MRPASEPTIFCPEHDGGCAASLTIADEEMGACTQCRKPRKGMRGRIEYVTEQPRPEQAGSQCDHNEMVVGPPSYCAKCGYRYGVDDAPAVPERGERWTSVNMTEDPGDPRFTIEEGDKLLATVYDAATAARIITEHEQHSTLIAQRERLREALYEALSYIGAESSGEVQDQIRTALKEN